ncbi:hypothetical protein [Streptomyces mirabilis]|jgi:hypothetical protein|uniref:Uncharacterized protein n=1 Tax=Streptomyces mirabilis TaxID=68239 RepID=A0A1I2JTF2_9ACTN|nr:hypothetical protein [Streptomyces mirabilis]SFF56407.1 hypothetical protein SAMN02787118_108352 [Streptomyces mirabilis]
MSPVRAAGGASTPAVAPNFAKSMVTLMPPIFCAGRTGRPSASTQTSVVIESAMTKNASRRALSLSKASSNLPLCARSSTAA